ncbi:galactokinase [Maribacter cobaltidurans]|uniref:Galactokinase n=1 Tax=Maribacter cobaltidurans TaxID=1178778 RepID=A0A223V312_9FLAO|nr:galactokinase [Maribacter cobaltidurans]ASV29702.1 galactokinase [Maribacter cobaltidurans]GGD66599.1 galactokinase [Maribacter cobaltidurans]
MSHQNPSKPLQKFTDNRPTVQISSPGRINLIGEHIDYNDGFVLPAAIDKCIYLALKANGHESRCTIRSEGFKNTLVVGLDKLGQGTEGWHNYVIGVIAEINKLSGKLRGFDCNIESKVPIGSGVSSSAALECGLAYGLNVLFGLGLDKWELIKIGQRAEHNFVGTKCGIMDQFASVMGKDGHTMLLDCRSLDFKYIPTNLEPYRLLLLNTNVSHNLSTGEYNVRREQCQKGLTILTKLFNIKPSFRNVTLKMLDEAKEELGTLLYDRCSYVVEETKRVLDAAEALEANNLDRMGQLMYESHEGLSSKYEVSCPELDFLVEFSNTEPQILGTRMMGGGFGGCTLNLIHKDALERFIRKVTQAYKKEFDLDLSYFQTVPSQGTSTVSRR